MRRVVALVTLLLTTLPAGTAEAGEKGQGTEGRRWITQASAPPASISAAQYSFTTAPVVVPMRDGASLVGVLYTPVGLPASDPKPCVLFDEGYAGAVAGGITGPIAQSRLQDFARRGYARLYLNLREGSRTPVAEGLYYRYAEDGYDAIEWAASQTWCDTVGMIGGSLNGISAWLPASLRPPHLKAIAPEIACGDCYWYLWNKGGTLPGAGRAARKPPTTATDEFAAASPHRTYDAWWDQRNTTAAEHRKIAEAGIAALQCGGWNDYITPGGMRGIEQINAAGGHGLNLMGPCTHGASTQQAIVGNFVPDPPLLPYDLQTYTVLWFDRWLKGVKNGFDSHPEALIHVQGPDEYRYEKTWPPADTHWSNLYLRATRSGSATSRNDGSLLPTRPGARDAAVSYVHDPAGPLNSAGGGGAPPAADQRPEEANFLTWTTSELAVPTEITGWPRLQFHASSTAADTDFVAEITDVSPQGISTVIGRGWLNAPQSFSRSSPRPLVKGRTYRFDMELWPMAYVVQKGHRIRVALSGSDSPGTGVNPNTATVTIHQDAAHPSLVSLPVIGTGWRALESSAGTALVPRLQPGSTAPRSSPSLAVTGPPPWLPGLAGVLLLFSCWAVRRRRHEP